MNTSNPERRARLTSKRILGLLAYGVTTLHDPQAGSTADKLSYADEGKLARSWDLVISPLALLSGTQERLAAAEDTRNLVLRYSRYYHTHTLKNGRRATSLAPMGSRSQPPMHNLTTVGHWNYDLVSQVLDGHSWARTRI